MPEWSAHSQSLSAAPNLPFEFNIILSFVSRLHYGSCHDYRLAQVSVMGGSTRWQCLVDAAPWGLRTRRKAQELIACRVPTRQLLLVILK